MPLNQSDYGYTTGSCACRCCGSMEPGDCCPGTKELRWDGSAKVWEVFRVDTQDWLGAFDTRTEALALVRAIDEA